MHHHYGYVTPLRSSAAPVATEQSGALELHMSHHATPASCAVMEQIKNLLLAPATDTPLNAEIASQYTTDFAAYEAKVRKTVAAYARDDTEESVRQVNRHTPEWGEEERLLSWKTTWQLEIDLQSDDDDAPNQFAPAYAYAGEGSGDEDNTYMVEGALQQYQLFVRGDEVPVESHDAVTRVEEGLPTGASVLLKGAFLVYIAC